jgi:hypothetical protein
MTYSSTILNFPRNIIVLQYLRWFTPACLLDLMRLLRTIYFPIVEARAQGFAALALPEAVAPFSVINSPQTRFPTTQVYATEADPVLSRIFSQLSSSLSYKDRLLATTNTGVTDRNVSSLTAEYVSSFNAFQSALLALTDYIANPDNFYSQRDFEAAYTLTWT